MCDPVSIAVASFAVGTAGSILQYRAQSATAKAQERVEAQRFEETEKWRVKTAENARQAYIENAATLQIRHREEQISRSDQVERIERERREAVGTAIASSKGAGFNLAAILGDFERQSGRSLTNVATQAKFNDAQYGQELAGLRDQVFDTINGARGYIGSPVVHPSLAQLGVNIAGNALSSATGYRNMTTGRAA